LLLLCLASAVASDLAAPLPTLEEWPNDTGRDLHSIPADPRLADATKGDSPLRPGRPAIDRGRDRANIGACKALQT
jgi:hypothetical protein